MKSEPKKKSRPWLITEDKYLRFDEYKRLRKIVLQLRTDGMRMKKFYMIRDWFMIELGLFTGLRVEEMSLLKIEDMLIWGEQSSVVVRNCVSKAKTTIRRKDTAYI